jgi:hypothetical protein
VLNVEVEVEVLVVLGRVRGRTKCWKAGEVRGLLAAQKRLSRSGVVYALLGGRISE